MTWTDAKADTMARIAKMGLPEGKLAGWHLVLFEFEDEATYDFCTGPHTAANAWSLEYYKMVNEATYRELRRRGAIVEWHIFTRNHIIWKREPTQETAHE